MHVNLIRPEIVAAMKAGGCVAISLGVESGNDEILRLNRKTYTREKALAAARVIQAEGIYLSAFFMIGLPQETRETILDTLATMKALRCDYVCYSIFTPYPGTEIFRLCEQLGLIPPDYDPALYNHQSPANHFVAHLSPKEFRALARRVERYLNWRTRLEPLRRVFSRRALRRLRDLGPAGVMRRLLQAG